MLLNSKDLEEAIRITKDAKPLHEAPLSSVWPILRHFNFLPWCKANDQDELKISLVEEDSGDDRDHEKDVDVEAYKQNPFKVFKNKPFIGLGEAYVGYLELMKAVQLGMLVMSVIALW